MDTIPAPLKGKVAVVTGGSQGIGAGLAQKFAYHGCTHIAITYNTNKAKAENVLASIRKINSKIETCAFAADVMDPEFGVKVVKQSLAGLKTDHIDIMISNACYVEAAGMQPIADMTKEGWDKWMTGTAWASTSLAKAVISHMPPGGRIIMMSSGSSKIALGDPSMGYAAGKAAMDSVSRNLAAAWSLKYGVTVNTISVGTTRTQAVEHAFKAFGDDFEKMATDFSMLKRIAEVEEIANIVAFVASPEAGWIVGNQIPANGGAMSMLQS